MHLHRPAITDRRIRFALVGCGRIASNHFDAIAKHREQAELIAVCDNDPGALSSAVTRTGAEGFASLTDMLARVKADCVVVCTPSGLHPQQVKQIANAGMDAMTEKPMATRWRVGLALVRACVAAAVRLFVVQQNRRNPPLQML